MRGGTPGCVQQIGRWQDMMYADVVKLERV